MGEGKDLDGGQRKSPNKVIERLERKKISRAVSLAEHLNSGGNTPARRTRALELMKDLPPGSPVTNRLIGGADIGWRKQGEVPDDQLDSKKMNQH